MILNGNRAGFQQFGRQISDLEIPDFKTGFPWRGADLQTLRNRIKGPSLALDGDFERITFDLGPGRSLKAALHRSEKSAPRPLIILIHGLAGCETSSSIISAEAEGIKTPGIKGLRQAILNIYGQWGKRMKAMILTGLMLTLAACSTSPATDLLKENHRNNIARGDFGICKGYGCKYYLKTGLSEQEWQQIVDIFVMAPENAEEERQLIKRAIAKFEQYIGPKTGTNSDDAGAQIINFSTRDQMDCIDEAFNSSTYLFLLRKAGLIRFHSLGKPLHRGNYITRWPHNTATIHERGLPIVINGDGHYVVDSWFHANGKPPEIIPASVWSGGWSPDK